MTQTSLFKFEEQTIAPIPEDQRAGKSRELVAIWFGMNMTPITVVTGALATTVFGLSLWWALVAMVLGHALGGIGMALHAAQGPRLGVPQMLQARGQFGAYGAALILVIASVMFVGFFSSNLVVASSSFAAIYPYANSGVVLVVTALISLLIAAFGYALVRRVTAIGSYVVGALVLVSFVAIAINADMGKILGAGNFNVEGFFGMLAIGVVWQIAYAPYVSDYSRYMPAKTGASGAFWGSYTGCVSSSIILMLLGAAVGLAAKGEDTMANLHTVLGVALGFIVLLAFALVVATVNAVNLYCSALCTLTFLQTFKPKWTPRVRSRLITSVVLVAVAVLIALGASASFLTVWSNFLSILLYVLIPWSAINLVDYYLVRHADYAVKDFFTSDGGRYGRWNVGALAVFVIGGLIQIPFMSLTFFVGSVSEALGYVDLAWLVGFGVSGILYYIIARAWPSFVRIDKTGANHTVGETVTNA